MEIEDRMENIRFILRLRSGNTLDCARGTVIQALSAVETEIIANQVIGDKRN